MAAHPLFSSFVAAAVERRDTLSRSAQREGAAPRNRRAAPSTESGSVGSVMKEAGNLSQVGDREQAHAPAAAVSRRCSS
jgi:hypothetical protein